MSGLAGEPTAQPRHLLELDDLTPAELREVLDAADRTDLPPVLAGRGVALVFEKPSNRTRSATEMAVVQLGGHPVSIRAEEVGIDTRETAEDVVRTLACFHAVVGARVFDHAVLERMAAVSPVPVVNLLSDAAHPLQALADLLTLRRHWGALDGRSVAWVGDWSNVARSLAVGARATGLRLHVAAPQGYGPAPEEVERLDLVVADRAEAAVEGVDAVATDVWTSMGQEDEAAQRHRAFESFTVDGRLMGRAAPGAVFLHCLPVHRGEEVSGEVVDGAASLVWPQAENRMHAARAALWWLQR